MGREIEYHIAHSTYNYDSDSKQWLGIKKEETVYDEGKKTLLTVYNWSSTINQWINYERAEFSYFPSKSIEKGYNWDTLSSQWVIYCRHEISYDPDGRIILIETFDIDPDLDECKYNNTIEYEYDAEGREILVIYSLWHFILKELTPESKIETTYNENGQKTSSIIYDWDIDTKDWNLYTLKEYYYDGNENSVSDIEYRWSISDNQWNLERKVYYYYSLHDISFYPGSIDTAPIRIYPNPVNEELNLYTTEIINNSGWLYNSNGYPVLKIELVEGTNTYNISHLSTGLYLIMIPTKNDITFLKIIKK